MLIPIRTPMTPARTAPRPRPAVRELPETPQEKAEYCRAMAALDDEPYSLILTPSGLVVAVPTRRLSVFPKPPYTCLYCTL